jgi:hypothetical protein
MPHDPFHDVEEIERAAKLPYGIPHRIILCFRRLCEYDQLQKGPRRRLGGVLLPSARSGKEVYHARHDEPLALQRI